MIESLVLKSPRLPRAAAACLTSTAQRESILIIMPKKKPLITNYGRFWERTKLFEADESPAQKKWIWNTVLEEGHGIYILYRGMTPVYVGSAMGRFGVFKRLQQHNHDWLAPIWDNVCWYVFDDNRKDIDKTISVVESLLIASIPGLLNSAQPSHQLGEERFPEKGGKETSYGSNTLWKKTA